MNDFQLPEGWDKTTIGKQCNVISGQSPKGEFYNSSGEGLPFYQGKKEFAEKFIGEPKKWTSHVTKEAILGDILMSVRAPVGPINFSTQKICIGRGLAAIRAGDKIDKNFLFYYLLSKQDEISGTEGAVFSSINRNQIENIEIFLPSLSEQRKVIATLDKAFKDINQAIVNTEKNLANARELFESYLDNVFTQKGDDWVETSLGNIANFKNGLNYSRNSKGECIRIVGVRDFQSNFFIPIEQLTRVQIDGGLSSSYELQENDILTVRSNGNKNLIGRCILAKNISHSGFTIRIRLKSSEIEPAFLVHYLMSGIVHNRLTNSGSGINISSLNQQALSSLYIVFPNKNEQLRIIENIEAIKTETSRLVVFYQQKLTVLNELKQSIMQKAFTGELTPVINQ